MYRESLEHLVIPEGKKAIKVLGSREADSGVNLPTSTAGPNTPYTWKSTILYESLKKVTSGRQKGSPYEGLILPFLHNVPGGNQIVKRSFSSSKHSSSHMKEEGTEIKRGHLAAPNDLKDLGNIRQQLLTLQREIKRNYATRTEVLHYL